MADNIGKKREYWSRELHSYRLATRLLGGDGVRTQARQQVVQQTAQPLTSGKQFTESIHWSLLSNRSEVASKIQSLSIGRL